MLLGAFSLFFFFFCGGLFISALAHRILPQGTPWLRLCALVTLAYGLMIGLGGALLYFGMFKLPMALASVAFLAFSSHVLLPFGEHQREIASDIRQLCGESIVFLRMIPWWIFLPLGFLFIAAIRVLLLPPTGWDTFTYHGVKAAFFYQGGALSLPELPGAWMLFRHFSPGNEILQAWMLLPLGDDLFFNLLDILQLGTLLLFLVAIALRVGLQPLWVILLILYLSSVPSIWRAMGAGYVEYALYACLLSGIFWLYLLCFDEESDAKGSYLLLAWVSFGAAFAVKMTAAITILFGILCTLSWLVRSSFPRFVRMRLLFWAAMLALLINLPWLIQNTKETGAPLSPYPLRVMGITLGKGHQLITWLNEGIASVTELSEMRSFLFLFGLNERGKLLFSELCPHLSPLSLLFLFIFFLFFLPLLFSLRGVFVFFLGFLIPPILFYMTPSMAFTRLWAACSNGRFLWLSLFLICLLCFFILQRFAKRTQAYSLLFVLMACVNWLSSFSYGWRREEVFFVGIALLISLALFFLLKVCFFNRSFSPPFRVILFSLVWVSLFGLLRLHKDQTRFDAWRKSRIYHGIDLGSLWWRVGRYLERQPSKKIAMTTGPNWSADRQMLYPILGATLQHRLLFVSPWESGEVTLVGKDYPVRRRAMSFSHWIQNVMKARPDYILSYPGESQELVWMRQHPQIFQEIVGASTWGFFRISLATSAYSKEKTGLAERR
jgi:4-amino-4-deoxy-L-arabinose transferase-like glycosyltransferase